MKKLNEIIKCQYDTLIKGIKLDSRDIEPGDLFVAVKGFNVDHSIYIDSAIEAGAVAVITEEERECSVPLVVVDDVSKALVEVCRKFYNYNDELELIGITGTDGKTTTATIIENILNHKNVDTAYMGTNGLKMGDKLEKLDNTTPATDKLYYYLGMLKDEKFKKLVMEVSSEALLHGRVDDLKFKYAVFSNITEDHLNIHKTVDNYIQSKNKLVNLLSDNGFLIINGDDEGCSKLVIPKSTSTITYGTKTDNDYVISNIEEFEDIMTFDITVNNNTYNMKTHLFGKYNVYNITAAFIVAKLEGISEEEIIDCIDKILFIPGRSEMINFGQDYTIILDYAHTENSIRNIVENTKNRYHDKKIVVVTGQAGGREKEKRRGIGKYLLNNVDNVIFTMDDPRYESVDEIIDQMIGDSENENYERIIDREEAIKYALDNADSDTVVLVLGKGRDTYMAIEDRKDYYCDYDVIEKYFKEK